MNLAHVIPHMDEEATGPSQSVTRLCEALAEEGQVVELHTGAYCDAVRDGSADAGRLLANLKSTAAEAGRLGLEVHAGHGIDYETVRAIAEIPELAELNIGHFLIGEAIFVGLTPAIQRMRSLMDQARIGRAA